MYQYAAVAGLTRETVFNSQSIIMINRISNDVALRRVQAYQHSIANNERACHLSSVHFWNINVPA